VGAHSLAGGFRRAASRLSVCASSAHVSAQRRCDGRVRIRSEGGERTFVDPSIRARVRRPAPTGGGSGSASRSSTSATAMCRMRSCLSTSTRKYAPLLPKRKTSTPHFVAHCASPLCLVKPKQDAPSAPPVRSTHALGYTLSGSVYPRADRRRLRKAATCAYMPTAALRALLSHRPQRHSAMRRVTPARSAALHSAADPL
jgi:hypothetical protein